MDTSAWSVGGKKGLKAGSGYEEPEIASRLCRASGGGGYCIWEGGGRRTNKKNDK